MLYVSLNWQVYAFPLSPLVWTSYVPEVHFVIVYFVNILINLLKDGLLFHFDPDMSYRVIIHDPKWVFWWCWKRWHVSVVWVVNHAYLSTNVFNIALIYNHHRHYTSHNCNHNQCQCLNLFRCSEYSRCKWTTISGTSQPQPILWASRESGKNTRSWPRTPLSGFTSPSLNGTTWTGDIFGLNPHDQ